MYTYSPPPPRCIYVGIETLPEKLGSLQNDFIKDTGFNIGAISWVHKSHFKENGKFLLEKGRVPFTFKLEDVKLFDTFRFLTEEEFKRADYWNYDKECPDSWNIENRFLVGKPVNTVQGYHLDVNIKLRDFCCASVYYVNYISDNSSETISLMFRDPYITNYDDKEFDDFRKKYTKTMSGTSESICTNKNKMLLLNKSKNKQILITSKTEKLWQKQQNQLISLKDSLS